MLARCMTCLGSIATKNEPITINSVSFCECVCMCIGVRVLCVACALAGAIRPSSPAGRLCPVGITCHGAESLIDASCFSGGNYSAQMSRPNLWLCNVDTWARGRGDTAAPEGLARRFGQQMWGAEGVTAARVCFSKSSNTTVKVLYFKLENVYVQKTAQNYH